MISFGGSPVSIRIGWFPHFVNAKTLFRISIGIRFAGEQGASSLVLALR
jgi:hypothetical protein